MPLFADIEIPYVQDAAITIDALAEEPAWREAQRITGLVEAEPSPGDPPTATTTAWLVADSEALYVLIEVVDPEPESIRARIGRRDTRWNDDSVALYLDPSGDGQRSYFFSVNPLGVQMDGTQLGSVGYPDLSWDGIWEAETTSTPTGYRVELAIPWRIVRHPPSCDRVGLLIGAYVARSSEVSYWPEIDPDVQGLLIQQAVVGGPGELPPSRGLDLIPELSWGLTGDGPDQTRWGVGGASPGLTVRWSPTPTTSLLAAANPDFSEVESDGAQIEVNRRYALYYEEKRPFFLEGREWFEHPFGELVYTRAMVQPAYGVHATQEGKEWTAAALHVMDSRPSGSVSEGGGWSDDDLEGHQAMETVLRLRRHVGNDGHVGLLASDKSVLGTGLTNRLLGVDTYAHIGDKLTAEGALLTSQTTFTDGATTWVPAASGSVGHSSEHWLFDTWFDWVDPDFRAENGYIVDADLAGVGARGGYIARPEADAVPLIYMIPVATGAEWHTDGTLRYVRWTPHTFMQFGNGTTLMAGYQRGGELWSDTWLDRHVGRLYAGGPWTDWLQLWGGTASGLSPYYDSDDPRSVLILRAIGELILEPVPRLALGFEGGWERAIDGGETLYDGWVGRARLDAYATRTLWARAILDRSSFSELTAAEVLMAWEQAPGRAIYLGGRVDDDGEELAWRLQSKVSWVLSR